eukprot:TRINITY_DN26036_c0_g1_i3.p1 TRINITY_DN26036_c0_g1~~TRINITY_DN26036_c0_g1_i3.p1  ORF type:complete len:254 (+),score=57.44 TRINITY_DN26036_c0_g1_i3:57-818(+)
MIRRPPRSTLSSSSAASDVYKRQEYGELLMGVCESTSDDNDPLPESHKTGDGQAAVERIEAEHAAASRERASSDALAKTMERTITIVVGINDPDVPDSLRGKRLSWTTRVGQTTRVDTVLGDWYMSKVNATALLDPLGDVGNLRSLVPQWPLEQDNAWFNGDGETGDQGKLSEYKEGCTFGQIWSAHPSVPEGPVRFIGPVSYTHLRAHETPEHLVCRLLLEKKKNSLYKQENSSEQYRITGKRATKNEERAK